MSKAQLKKELAGLDKEQIIQVVLDAYAARKETKAYFDFFLNPDVDRLADKYKMKIAREFGRTKRRMSKARISVINGAVKEFASYSPGAEHVIDLTLYVISFALMTEDAVKFSDTLYNGIAKMTLSLLGYGEEHLLADRVLAGLLPATDPAAPCGSRYFRRLLRDTIAGFRPGFD